MITPSIKPFIPLSRLLLTSFIATSLITTGCSNSTHTRTPAPIVDPQATSKPTQQATPNTQPSSVAQVIGLETPKLPTTSPIPPEETGMIATTDTTLPTQADIQAPVEPVMQLIKNDQIGNIKRLVVLLPDRPNLQQVNRDILQGIKQAHRLKPHHAGLEIISIHDDLSMTELVAKANALAPDAIIGPLTKTDIQQSSQLSAKVMVALNRAQEADQRWQLGLAPEDEIQQLLTQRKQKHLPIAVFSSHDAQDKRLLTSLEQALAVDATPLLHIPYSGTGKDFNDWLKQEGKLEHSQKRINALKQHLRQPVQAEPRLRRDIQAFISLSSAKQTRPLLPALAYYQAPWKLLATSKLLPARKGSDLYEPDLDGLQVLVSPYLLNNTPINNAFEALGHDAYQLLAYQEVSGLAGQTGKLSSKQKQVFRQLEWRNFQKGKLKNWQQNTPTNPQP